MKPTTALGYIGTLALLATGCAETTSAFAWDDEGTALPSTESEMVTRNVPARGIVASAWQLPPSSPWSPYEKLTLLSVMSDSRENVSLPRLDDIDEIRIAQLAAARVASQGIPPDAMWMVDLRGPASVAFGAALSRKARESVAVIPTFNNWPAKDELVPAEETLAALIAYTPRLPDEGDVDARPVFLLDSWRMAFKEETVDDQVTDNRYMLGQADFPSAYALLSHGISHVVYLVTDVDDAMYEEDDLNTLFLAYQAAGIEIHMIGLGEIVSVDDGPEPPASIAWYLHVQNRFYVRPRRTVVYDEMFYRRAHGGFGGVHGVPIGSGHTYMFAGGHGGG